MSVKNNSSSSNILVINSNRRQGGTFNNFYINLPFKSIFSSITLSYLYMLVPSGTNNIEITVNELEQPTQIAGAYPVNSTFTIPVPNADTNITWSSSGDFKQIISYSPPRSFSVFTITVNDDNDNPVALTADWTMVLSWA